MHNISNLFYFGTKLYKFRVVSPSIIRSLRVYIHQVHVIQVLWLYAFFWVISRSLNFIFRRFETLCSIFIGG